MGCCSPNVNNNMIDFRFEKVEEFNILKLELDEIINDKNHKYRKNINKLLDLFNKTSNKITEYEKESKIIKNKKEKNNILDSDILQDLNNDIKQLRVYNHTINDLIKDCDENENANNKINKEKKKEKEKNGSEYNYDDYFENGNEIINEEIINTQNKNQNQNNNDEYKLKSFKNHNLEHFIEHDFEDGYNKNNFQLDSENDFQNDFLINDNEKNDSQKELFNDLNIDKINNISYSIESNLEKEEKVYYKKSIRRNKKSEILNRKTNTEQKNNLINLILVLENGKKINVQADKNQNFLEILERLGKMEEEYKNLENIKLFDENGEITDKIKNEDKISSLGLNENQIIQVKLDS